jgi:ABC-type transport system involved in Fe-S cluster assembly fused permease/ATPase subunit
MLLEACKSTRSLQQSKEETPHFLSSKLQLTIPYQGDIITLSGIMKMKSGERIQSSFLMPVLRYEVVCMDITPNEVLFVDRMNKCYVRAAQSDINALLTRKINFEKLEELLFDASQSGEKATITAEDLNLKSFGAVKLRLYDFSTADLTIVPTEVPARYKPVDLDELLKLLLSL